MSSIRHRFVNECCSSTCMPSQQEGLGRATSYAHLNSRRPCYATSDDGLSNKWAPLYIYLDIMCVNKQLSITSRSIHPRGRGRVSVSCDFDWARRGQGRWEERRWASLFPLSAGVHCKLQSWSSTGSTGRVLMIVLKSHARTNHTPTCPFVPSSAKSPGQHCTALVRTHGRV